MWKINRENGLLQRAQWILGVQGKVKNNRASPPDIS